MKTPSHALVNVGVLSLWSSPSFALPLFIGAVLPDISIFILYFWAKFWKKEDEKTIWSEIYYQKFWQDLVALFHSFPVCILLLGIGIGLQWTALIAAAASLILHNLGDFPLHHDDAHRHFYPLSEYRFVSPLSYWDTKHYGKQVAAVEDCLTLCCCIYVLATSFALWLKVIAIAVGILALFLIPFSPLRLITPFLRRLRARDRCV
ncbi:MAG: hypothetical protein AAGB01_02005 [Cyanobacteria bacterium P01_F01_bin.42]